MEAGSSQAVLEPGRRSLIVRDSLKFVTLLAVAAVMAGVTTFLFRSFESHREALAVRWADRGRAELKQGRSAKAVDALRTSLGYAPDNEDNQLALAQALAASGHGVEAENYYLGLWQSQPGDGPINLQLARLERSRGLAEKAVDYYRAAVFGTWSGDAPVRRRDVRLELSRYLVERGQMQAAQAELTVAAGNNPDGPTQMVIGETLEAARDPRDALTAYRNASEDAGQRDSAEARAGELCYRMGDYACAESFLEKAMRSKTLTEEQRAQAVGMRKDSARLLELAFSHEVPPADRTTHLLQDARIAQIRLNTCAASEGAVSPELGKLQARWKLLDTAKNRDGLRKDDDLQDEFTGLLWDTEDAATKACGAAVGDDALLLSLREHPLTHFGDGR